MASRAIPVSYDNKGLRCPICFSVYTVPKTLPCLHTYCQQCLHKYIMETVSKGEICVTFMCPECRKETYPHIPDTPVDKWAGYYPCNIVVLCALPPEKRTVDNMCDPCMCEGNYVRATSYCTVCSTNLCLTCEELHTKNKTTMYHDVVTIQNIFTDLKLAVKMTVGVTCSEHDDKEFAFYCKSHKIMCCSECFNKRHMECWEVLDMHNHSEMSSKDKEIRVIERLKQLKSYLDKFRNVNEELFKVTKAKLESMPDDIEEIRKKFHSLVDNERNQIAKEKYDLLTEMSSLQEENKQCQSILIAIASSLYLLEAVLKYGNPLQISTALHKIEEHLVHYDSTVRNKYSVRRIKAKLCIDDRLSSLTQSSEIDFANIDMVEEKHSHTSSKPQKDWELEGISYFDADYLDGKVPWYTCITCLPNGNIMLGDRSNCTFRLYDSSYQHIADYKLTSGPYDVCVVDGSQVAVTLPEEKKIKIMYVNRSMQLGRSMHTSLICGGIVALSRDPLLVLCGRHSNVLYWCTISMDGLEKSKTEVCPSDHYNGHLAVNYSRTLIYVSCYSPVAVFAYNLDGTLIFKYAFKALFGAAGIALDRADNLYVVGNTSHNIHQVSPDGVQIHVFSKEILKCPYAICFTGNECLLTGDTSKLVQKLKFKY
ncbi:hypothetical protein ACJMK2_010539 [Sinanodonta woodiana]|uniref:Uncharacterized protein n=1 Tax=Sinanodonta woodiana TaxID=1069815 RepID=A0ABD3VG04_SINWO